MILCLARISTIHVAIAVINRYHRPSVLSVAIIARVFSMVNRNGITGQKVGQLVFECQKPNIKSWTIC